jgi:acyl-CoA hydrolase
MSPPVPPPPDAVADAAMIGKSPAFSATHQEHLVRPQHANALQSLFGGELMAWVDIAAATCAMRHCGKSVVTASVDALHFLAPIPVGWLVCLDASVNYTATSSCEVGVRVTAVNPINSAIHHTASAYLTFVALGEGGKPVPIPKIIPQTPKDHERYAAAAERRRARLELKARLTGHQPKRGG